MRINMKKFVAIILCVILLFALLAVILLWACRQDLTVRVYAQTSSKLNSPVRIALLTDLHSTIYGEGQRELIEAIRAQQPDIICLAGDIADDVVPHDGTKQLLSVISQEYPCYYVSGNHEYWSGEADAIKEMIRAYGVTVLEGEAAIVTIEGQALQLYGVDDPDAFAKANRSQAWQAQFEAFTPDAEIYSVLLSHRPELTDFYTNCEADLVLAGHAHGGQVRLPGFINGVFAPDQGFFPAYAGGQYTLDIPSMIVSRGLCKNNLPRVFNPPELVVVDLLPEHLVE